VKKSLKMKVWAGSEEVKILNRCPTIYKIKKRVPNNNH